MEADLALVIDCLKHHDVDNYDAQKDSLLTIAALCTESDTAKNHFREGGGLGYVLNLLTSVNDDDVKVTVLYALGCATERNVYSQSRLCSDILFKYLQCQLKSLKSSVKLKRSATFLICCLVTNNSAGQTCVRTSGCLDCLLSTLSKLVKCKGSSQALLTDIIKTLGYCVNNPQNGDNQQLCASVFPNLIQVLEESTDAGVLQQVSSFLSLTVSNNEANQDRLGLLGGLDVIVSILQDMVQSFIKSPDKQEMSALIGLITTLGVTASDHNRNCEILSELRLIPLLVQLLSSEVITNEAKLKIILTMSSVTQSSEMSQKQLVRSDGLALLVQILLQNEDDNEMRKTISSVLESCLQWVTAVGTEDLLYSSALAQHSTKAQRNPVALSKSNTSDPLLMQFKEVLGGSSNSLKIKPTINLAPHQRNKGDAALHIQTGFDSQNHRTLQIESEKLNAALEKDTTITSGPLSQLLQLISNHSDHGRMKTADADVCSLPLKERESTDDVSDVTTVTTYGDINEKLVSLEDKFDRVLEYVYSRKMSGGSDKDGEANTNISLASKEVDTGGRREMSSNNIDNNINTEKTEDTVTGSRNGEYETTRRLGRSDEKVTIEERGGHQREEDEEAEGQMSIHNSEQKNNTGSDDNKNSRLDTDLLLMAIDGSLTKETIKQSAKQDVYCKRCRNKSPAGSKKGTPKIGERRCTVLVSSSQTTRADSSRVVVHQHCVEEDEVNGDGSDQAVVDDDHIGMLENDVEHSSSGVDASMQDEMSGWRRRRSCRMRKWNLSSSLPIPNERGDGGLRAKEPSSSRREVESECPACSSSSLLNSKCFVKNLMSSRHTCTHHKTLVSKIQTCYDRRIHKLGHKRDVSSRESFDVYNFSEDERQAGMLDRCKMPMLPKKLLERSTGTKRRHRQDFSQAEIHNLMRGVQRHGKHWQSILWTYDFKKGRTGVDLKDKYRRLMRNQSP